MRTKYQSLIKYKNKQLDKDSCESLIVVTRELDLFHIFKMHHIFFNKVENLII